MNDLSPAEIPAPFEPEKMQLLLEQLKQLEASTGISWWPPAIGWWILAILSIVALACLARFLFVQYRIKQQQKQLLSEYRAIAAEFEQRANIEHYLTSVNQLMRRAVMLYLPRSTIANLQGDDWLSIVKLSAITIDDSIKYALCEACYQPNPTIDQATLDGFVADWLGRQAPKFYRAIKG